VVACLLPAAANAREEFEKGAKACLDCHGTDYVLGILETVHATSSDPNSPAAQKQCVNCHGPSTVHMKFPMQVANLHFGEKSEDKPEVQNKQCLECHSDGDRKEWEASAHGYEHVVCSTCHSAHDPHKIVPAEATRSSGCTESCHDNLLGSQPASNFSHSLGQDIDGKGALTCDSCHNPHGPLNSGRCTDCHDQTPEHRAKESEKARRFHKVAEKRGTECMRCHKGIAHPIPPLVLEKAKLEMERMVTD
jgi:nitrate/TMAO reductase-like tetraheme cytochrome c subunit